jgi:hypothetical protein
MNLSRYENLKSYVTQGERHQFKRYKRERKGEGRG